jgi:unsaturated rhamnogalacturonyl hydrolase
MISVRRIFSVLLFLGSVETPLPAQVDPSRALQLVADRVIAQTSYLLVDTNTGIQRNALLSAPLSGTMRIQSEYNDWTYYMGVVLTGMMRASHATGNAAYRNYVARNFQFIAANLSYFHDQWELLQVPRASFYRLFRMNCLDDCGSMGAALAEYYLADHQKRYLTILYRIANYIENTQLRLGDKTLSRPDPRYMTLWADDLYMSVPFLVQMGEIMEDQRYIDDAAHQILSYTSRLRDPATGLLRHAWFSDTQVPSVTSWGRANGWAVLAQTELLSNLPATYPLADSLRAVLVAHLRALCTVQDSTGLWHQVLDRPDSYLETSCSAMFCYGIARAVKRGWLDSSYAAAAGRAWNGICTRIRPDGQIEGICRGTEVGFDVDYYRNRPTPLNDTRGIGAVLLAGSEIMAMKKK